MISSASKRFIIVGLIVILAISGYYFFLKKSDTKTKDDLAQKLNNETKNQTAYDINGDKNLNVNTSPQSQSQNGLKIEILKEGEGRQITSGETAVVNYSGRLITGQEFDSSYKRGTPFSFVLGKGEVIRGWDMGILGMRVGEKRRLTISPELGYGNRDLGVIPPNSTLVFEVELLEIK